MCGIAGIIDYSIKHSTQDMIRIMTHAMAHRGPDAEGIYSDGPVALGHRRLSIIDLSTGANQPMTDTSGRYTIVFNGEIYNYQHLKAQLKWYHFQTTSDTEVILAAFIQWGAASVEKLVGMFAYAIWDNQDQRMHLFRDRLGVKPLYYHQDRKLFLFSSEIRSLLAGDILSRKLNKETIAGYFSFQSISSPGSPVSSIQQLKAGHYMVVDANAVQFYQYWKPAPTKERFDWNDKGKVLARIRELMCQAVERRLVSDVPVAAFLSGGIDSSAVVGLMAEVGNTTPSTFNISFSEKDYDESAYAELVSKKFKTDHHVIRLHQDDFLHEITNALDAMDTPSGDGINTYVVSKAIRKAGIRVALSGVGGDELFAGYPFFKTYLKLQHYSPYMSVGKSFRKSVAGFAGNRMSGKWTRAAQLLAVNDTSITSVYPIFRQILSPHLIRKLTTLSPDGIYSSIQARDKEISQYPLLSQVSIAEYEGYTQQTLLKDTDQMSMAHSLEVREPFFDHELIEFVLAVPDQVKYPVYPKSLLVEALQPLLPEEIVHRKKQGFLFPWNVWMKNQLKDFCENHLKNISNRDFIKGEALMGYWYRFQKGDTSVRWSELWLFVVLEYWMEKNHMSDE